jgi:uncharacterized membrane protein
VANVSVVFGLLLTAVGLSGYFGTGTSSPTALIPAGFGVPLILLGLLAYKDHLRKHAMHAAAVIGLLGFLGCAAMAVPNLPALVRDHKVIKTNKEGVERDATAAVLSQTVTGVLCGVFEGLCVNSFIQARRRRLAGAPSPTAAVP